MGISGSVYGRPAKFSTIIADADLDIGARAILSTNLSLYEMNVNTWGIYDRAKVLHKNLMGDVLNADDYVNVDILDEMTTGNGIVIDGLLVKDDKIVEPGSLNEPQTYAKVASNNNRHAHSYDGNRAPDASAYAKVAGMVFTNGIVGTVRVETDISSTNNTAKCEIKYVYNSVQKGIVKQSNHVHATYTTVTQDIALDIVAGGELELWMKCLNDVHTVYAKNWKIDYDNAADAIAVGQTEA